MPILDLLKDRSENFDRALTKAHERMSAQTSSGGGLESAGAAGSSVDAAAEAIRMGTANELPAGSAVEMHGALEAIILEDLRPAYFIENDEIVIHGDFDRIDLVTANKAMLEGVSRNIGRVDLLNHATMEYVGTGWQVSEDVVVTNRHVAQVFSRPRWQGGWDFADGAFGRPLRVEIDFMRQNEQASGVSRVARVQDVLFVAPQGGPDMAFLRVERNPDVTPVELKPGKIEPGQAVATVGYPAWDGRRNDADLMDDIFGGIYGVKRFSPGLIHGTDDEGIVILGDYSSLGGNSGSAVLDLESGEAVGLHFAGVFKDTNYAVAADIVAAALRDVSAPVVPTDGAGAVPPATAAAEFTGRNGYDPDFLGSDEFSVALPDLGERADDLAPVIDNPAGILRYTHFSVLQSKSRRLPMLTAVNIDGAKAFRLKRRGSWRLDGRLQGEHQIGNELYRHNPLDRGHMVRRKDPGWGNSKEEAQKAEVDTFHYTNCAPQHKDLNQRDWVGLEDYILEAAETRDFKVSVMTGPVFDENDRTLISQPGGDDVPIPKSFWKIAVMINDGTGKLSATGYLLTQGEMIRDITEAAFVLGKYKTYQVSIRRLEELSGFNWGDLRSFDPLGESTESAFGGDVRPLSGPESLTL
ncbi:DNA/RNA non-specific endonuclease [Alisedimentitalea sp. MJ-SS2]|uniref:DNA/RNA non-specific endonuclease n=1 Tax=Aliisedimentitalea sp. MJ-SS2 TaxID=3049795 RepID=UPI00290B1FF6|nr:DNA/RNA non-specific endonuclease [Alisedimentitalea sp. MJ-SS2]MDU8929922.1 DNA/RNA non-specific endonuclease [Alisedimentitalea sp. MJ-SS2]